MDMEIRALATANALLGALVKPTRDEAGADVWMLCRDVRYQVLVLYWRDTPLRFPVSKVAESSFFVPMERAEPAGIGKASDQSRFWYLSDRPFS